MKKLLSIVLCLILCFCMFACDKEKPVETQESSTSKQTSGTTNSKEQIPITGILGDTTDVTGVTVSYISHLLEYHTPRDNDSIQKIFEYFNSHSLLKVQEPIHERHYVEFYIYYNNEKTVKISGGSSNIGIISDGNTDEKIWYEIVGDNIVTPFDFFENIKEQHIAREKTDPSLLPTESEHYDSLNLRSAERDFITTLSDDTVVKIFFGDVKNCFGAGKGILSFLSNVERNCYFILTNKGEIIKERITFDDDQSLQFYKYATQPEKFFDADVEIYYTYCIGEGGGIGGIFPLIYFITSKGEYVLHDSPYTDAENEYLIPLKDFEQMMHDLCAMIESEGGYLKDGGAPGIADVRTPTDLAPYSIIPKK